MLALFASVGWATAFGLALYMALEARKARKVAEARAAEQFAVTDVHEEITKVGLTPSKGPFPFKTGLRLIKR